MRCLALVGLAACGRVGFDTPRSDASPDSPADAGCTLGAWTTPALMPNLVTAGAESFGPALSADALELIFQSDRSGGAGGFDLYRSTRPDVTTDFGPPALLANVDSPSDEENPTLSVDGLTMYFSSDRTGSTRIYRTTRADRAAQFSAPVRLDPLGAIEGASLSADGTELFAAEVVGSTSDLVRVTTFATSPAFDFLTGVNTAQVDEFFPTVSGDGLTLYYEGGGGHIHRAHRAAIGAPFAPDGEDTALSSATGDTDPEISKDGRTFVLSSDRGAAGFQLYIATRTCD